MKHTATEYEALALEALQTAEAPEIRQTTTWQLLHLQRATVYAQLAVAVAITQQRHG